MAVVLRLVGNGIRTDTNSDTLKTIATTRWTRDLVVKLLRQRLNALIKNQSRTLRALSLPLSWTASKDNVMALCRSIFMEFVEMIISRTVSNLLQILFHWIPCKPLNKTDVLGHQWLDYLEEFLINRFVILLTSVDVFHLQQNDQTKNIYSRLQLQSLVR